MANDYFRFKQFIIYQDKCSFKVGTDGVLLGASAEILNAGRILEIGTGTGLVAMMLAQRCNSEIIAIEPDVPSYQQAVSNVASCRWGKRIKVINTSLQLYYPEELKFDLIITNPPYFSNSLKNPDLRRAGSRHNDTLTGTDLLEGVARLLSVDGILQIILPYPEGTVFIAQAQEYGLYCNKNIKVRPLPTSDIKRLIMTFSRQKLHVKEKFLTIEKGQRHDFTDEYKNLTKDFYIKF